MASFVWPICSSYSSARPKVFFSRSIDSGSDCTAMATCSMRLIFMALILSGSSAREELDQPAVDLGRALVRRPVAGPGDAVQIQRTHGRADLADEERRGAERRVVPLAPEHAQLASQLREIAEQRAAAADLAAVEARAADVVDLDVECLLADAGRIAQHVDQQVVTADLAEEGGIVAGLTIAADRPLAKAARGEAARRDQGEVSHPRPEAPGQVRGDGAAEREAGEAQRRGAGE